MPRLVILVIASDGEPIYSYHQAYWRLYATRHPDVTVYFVRQSETVSAPYIDGDTMWTSGAETKERVFEKTLAAFQLIPTPYDYVVRTNLSSVWNFAKLVAFCRTLPPTKVYCGVPGSPGISGAGMILSPDVVQTFVDHSGEVSRCEWDDVDFGKIAERYAIPVTPATRYDPRSRAAVDALWDKGYHYYMKTMQNGVRNVGLELECTRYLIARIYGV